MKLSTLVLLATLVAGCGASRELPRQRIETVAAAESLMVSEYPHAAQIHIRVDSAGVPVSAHARNQYGRLLGIQRF